MKIIQYFIPNLESYPFFIQLRAKTLVYFLCGCGILLFILFVLLTVVLHYDLFTILSLYFVINTSNVIISLIFLKFRSYTLASNTFILIATAAFGMYVLMGTYKFEYGVIIAIFHLFEYILFSVVFCSRKITAFIITMTFAIATLAMLQADQIPVAYTPLVLINFGFELVIIALFAWLLSHINRSTIQKIQKGAENVASLEKTETLLTAIQKISKSLRQSSVEMSTTTNLFSENSQQQAASAEEMTATMEEISAGGESVAANAQVQYKSMEKLAIQLDDFTKQLENVLKKIKNTLETTEKIAIEARTGEKALNNMQSSMGKINNSSNEMSNIVGIINNISEQINLLSLNAAIEAARAGESGKGFAVVADEISKLADQTSSSVRDISLLINASEREVDNGLGNVRSTVTTISGIIDQVGHVNDMVEGIFSVMNQQYEINKGLNLEAQKVKRQSEEINIASEQQKNASADIVTTISIINQLTQTSASGSLELAKLAENVDANASSLDKKVADYSDK